MLAVSEPKPQVGDRVETLLPTVYGTTLFLSAGLLFGVQPMIAKMILPTFGGAPAVWNTCMVFFQAALLGGYLYAHAISNWLGPRKQAVLHGTIVTLPLLLLPIARPRDLIASSSQYPMLQVLQMLLISVGLPFFVVSTNAPLLQRWFSSTGHRRARDPYFLYAASNAGSLLALLAYPILVEPYLTLQKQAACWSAAYLLLMILVWVCAASVWHARRSALALEPRSSDAGSPELKRPGARTRMRWVALAFVPSSLLIAVTTHLTTDIAPAPLLWVLPLTVYVLSFIVAFARIPEGFWRALRIATPLAVLLQVFFLVAGIRALLPVIVVNLVTLLCACLYGHGALARSRPDARFLTEFYLWVSVGGVLGGVFNAFFAPLVFNWLVEYPLGLVLLCLLLEPLGTPNGSPRSRLLDVVVPLTLGICAMLILFYSSSETLRLQLGLLVAAAAATVRRPQRLALSVAAIVLVGEQFGYTRDHLIFRERNFYGVVLVADQDGYHVMLHGGTIHGVQAWSDDPRKRSLPLTYYHPTGPVGQVFGAFFDGKPKGDVGVIGLGAGCLASYGERGQHFTFFELDPAVVQLASNPTYFRYLRDSSAEIRLVLGDARLSLEDEPDGNFDLLIMDAFSGDAIPTHLLTREALRLYLRKLTVDGLLLFHITNHYVDLAPVIQDLAASEKVVMLAQDDAARPEQRGKFSSRWVLVARDPAHFGKLRQDRRWRSPPRQRTGVPWTDDYTNIFGALRYRRWW